MLTVPGHAACSWEQDIVTAGRSSTLYVAARRVAMAVAMSVSVASGMRSPCCSKLPTGRTAVAARRARTSAVVVRGIRSIGSSWHPVRTVVLDEDDLTPKAWRTDGQSPAQRTTMIMTSSGPQRVSADLRDDHACCHQWYLLHDLAAW